MSKKNIDNWIRKIDVSDPMLHRKGYTLYKVTSKVFPKNSVEAVSQVTVWKRYNDFKKLHKALSTLHQNLYLKDNFPAFAKTRFFGRFEPDVIEERRQSALNLLQFATNCTPLFTSQVFVKFFEDGHQVEEITRKAQPFQDNFDSILQPQRNSLVSDVQAVSEEKRYNNNDRKEQERGSSLGGIWQHHQVPDTISLGSHCTDEDDDDRTTFTDDDGTRSSLNLSEFDPLLRSISEESKPNQDSLCNSWLLSALQACGDVDCEKDPDGVLEFPAPFGDFEIDLQLPKVDTQGGKDALDSKGNHFTFDLPTPVAEEATDVTEFDPLGSKCDANLNGQEDSHAYDQFVMTPNAYSNDCQSKPSYFASASRHVCLAQEAEGEGRYQEAFDLYKKTIDILLQGFQKEEISTDLKDVVRKKILFYLMRAEELYETKLPKSNCNEKAKMDYPTLPGSLVKANLNSQGTLQDLNKYKVLGVLDKVLLVMDISTNNTFIVKTLYKSPCPRTLTSAHTIPQHKPFMVKLHQTFETSYALFLLLEHATGGRLWDYVSAFMQRSPLSPCNDGTSFDVKSKGEGELCNVYSGKKVEDGDRSKQVVDADLTPSENCPPSYVALFKRYADDADKEENVSLAKYHGLKARGKRRSRGMSDSHEFQNDLNKKINLLQPPKKFPNRLSSSTGSLEKTHTQKACNLDALNAMDDVASQACVTTHLPESCINTWAAEMVLALESLHNLGIIWTDFNPDNLLLGAEGHILLTYQGQWNNVDSIVSETAKEHLYCAPEVGSIFPVTVDCDWWSLGAILYELLIGQSLVSCHPTGISRHSTLNFPKEISPDAKDFVSKLLQYSPSERLGSGIYGIEEIKSHPFFKGINWKTLYS